MSSPATPAADRPLDAARAERAVLACFPPDTPGTESLQLLGSGWDHDVYRAPGGWLWRFPRRAKIARDLAGETRVVAFAHDVLANASPGLLTPRYERFGQPTEHFPYPFVGYREIGGVALDDVPRGLLDPASLGDALGAGLGALHQVDPARTQALDIRRVMPDVAARQSELVAKADRLAGVLPEPLRARCSPWLAGDVPIPAEYAGPPRVLHADMCPDHVIVAPENGQVVGIIDFADLSLGDPVRDYVGLVGWLGFDAIDAIWARHPLGFRQPDRERLVFLARVMSLLWLAEGVKHAGDIQKHIVWVSRSFQLQGG